MGGVNKQLVQVTYKLETNKTVELQNLKKIFDSFKVRNPLDIQE